ncbi:MAG: ribbon-helix-helix protein, CopG family [Hyphomicrobium sp.]
MKTAVSIPDKLYKRAEAKARKLGVSRSKLHRMALEQFLAKDADAEFTRRMNEAIA